MGEKKHESGFVDALYLFRLCSESEWVGGSGVTLSDIKPDVSKRLTVA